MRYLIVLLSMSFLAIGANPPETKRTVVPVQKGTTVGSLSTGTIFEDNPNGCLFMRVDPVFPPADSSYALYGVREQPTRLDPARFAKSPDWVNSPYLDQIAVVHSGLIQALDLPEPIWAIQISPTPGILLKMSPDTWVYPVSSVSFSVTIARIEE